MSAIILDGKRIATGIENYIRKHTEEEPVVPRLAILTDHSDPASEVYMRNKLKAAERCGIKAEVIDLPDAWTLSSMRGFIEHIAANHEGIILQLPLKNDTWSRFILPMIPPEADVDGLTPANAGLFYKEPGEGFVPCTPKGIVELLTRYSVPVAGKHAVIVGRSHLVGRPLAELLLQMNATVTVCHSRTQDLASHTKNADILVSAVGKPGLITGEMVKRGAAVVDVGINRVNGKLCGDVDFESVKEVAGWITPVPGGVGPMTVAMLMANTWRAYQ